VSLVPSKMLLNIILPNFLKISTKSNKFKEFFHN